MRVLLFFVLAAPLCAQDNTSDGSVLRARKLAQAGQVPKPEEIRVYDFINFRKHDIVQPKKGEAVALDVRALRGQIPDGDTEAALQIGVATHRSDKRSTPLNLALVIDKSGSMEGDDRMGYVKKALLRLVQHLNEDDVLSIIVYDTDASVLRAASAVSDVAAIRVLINSIKTGGSTNLHAGLMLGYQEAKKSAGGKRASKVVLLSDGQANQGLTELEKVVRDSVGENDKGVALSTVGIGLQYNDKLMNRLAEAGGGTYHFLDSAEGIQRVFEKEIISLLEMVGRKPEVMITLAPGVSLRNIYGYEIEQAAERTYRIRLLDLPLAQTIIIPVEVAVAAGFDRSKALAEVELKFTDARTKKPTTLLQSLAVGRLTQGLEAAADEGFFTNLTIARLAHALRLACGQAHNKKRTDARATLQSALDQCKTLLGGNPKDEDLRKVLEIARKTLSVLKS